MDTQRGMKIIDTPLAQNAPERGAAIAIGNFDGVHLGHRVVLDHARMAAERLGAPLGVLTFEPHPRSFFAPNAPDFRLMNAAAKAHRLEKLGVDILYQLPFNSDLSTLNPEDFARAILRDGLGVRHVSVGADFCFGKGRAGTVDDLIAFGRKFGFDCEIAPLKHIGPEEISSTAIRAALGAGDPRKAAALLGHWHRIEGPVIHGEKRGRELGFPTANMDLSGLHIPKHGVYAVLVDVLDGPHQGRYHGAASIGVRPMFGENTPNCETFLFDFKGDLYGAQLSIGLVDFLRPEAKFDGLAALIAQMDADCARAKTILATI